MKKVTTADVGAKVIRGPDWQYENQDEGSVYGIIESDSGKGWVKVKWMSEDGMEVNSNVYRIGNDDKYDLYYYEEPSTTDSVQGFRIGDVVDHSGCEAKILGFLKDRTACTIEYTSHKGGHDGSLHDYWYNEKGESIPYIKGNHRWYVSLKDLKHASKPKQTYLPDDHPDKIKTSKFQVGKWYKCTANANYYKCSGEDSMHFFSSEVISPDGTDCFEKGYNNRGRNDHLGDYFKEILEDLSVIQPCLPDGHPDKTSKIDDILQQCYTKYPVGTKYKCAASGGTFIVERQDFSIHEGSMIYGEHSKGCLYYKGKFAEIVSHEIPINYQPQLTDEQVENLTKAGLPITTCSSYIKTEMTPYGYGDRGYTVAVDPYKKETEIEPVESVSTPLVIKKRSYIYF